jgi:hypothetical protein
MKAKVVRIEEPDFGCEGRMPGMKVMDKVILKNCETGEEIITTASDSWLYEVDINEGDEVEVEEATGAITGKWKDEK